MDSMTQKIKPEDLVHMDQFQDSHGVFVDLAYAKGEAPNIFGQIYKDNARLYVHKDLADIILRAAETLKAQFDLHLMLYDGLRPVEAQKAMKNSPIVRANPHWLEEPGRLLSPPGAGAHPRGMAIDLTLCDERGAVLEMGTAFDHLAQNPDAAHNPAHRDHKDLPDNVLKNREILTQGMTKAAADLGHEILPLPQEWWDFRFPASLYQAYAPLSDHDLPADMRICL